MGTTNTTTGLIINDHAAGQYVPRACSQNGHACTGSSWIMYSRWVCRILATTSCHHGKLAESPSFIRIKIRRAQPRCMQYSHFIKTKNKNKKGWRDLDINLPRFYFINIIGVLRSLLLISPLPSIWSIQVNTTIILSQIYISLYILICIVWPTHKYSDPSMTLPKIFWVSFLAPVGWLRVIFLLRYFFSRMAKHSCLFFNTV